MSGRVGPLPPSFINTYSLDFDGVDDYVLIENGNFDATNGLTLSFWVKYDGVGAGNNWLFSNGGSGGVNSQFNTRFTADGRWFNYLAGGSFYTGINGLNDGNWHHLTQVIDYQNSIMYFYKDGSKSTTTRFSGYSEVDWSTISTPFFPFKGQVDEVALIGRVLTQSEITSISSTPTDLTDLSPIAWYRMGDNGTYKSPQWLIPSNENKDKVSNYSFDFDGMDDYVDCGDSDDFSFGNGTTDSPFSISAWIKMDDASAFRVATKYVNANREYLFTTDTSDRLSFALYDNSNGSRIQRKYNTALTSFQGQWINVIGTYDGSSLSSGIKIYLNGTRVDDIDGNLGTYIAMENTTQPLEIGRSNLTSFSNGKIDEAAIFNTELSSADALAIYNGGEPTTLPSGAVAHYKMGEEATFVYNVNPDGTWTIPDQVGSNDGTSNNQMADSARVGTAPSSSNNALSFNMDLIDRVTDVPT